MWKRAARSVAHRLGYDVRRRTTEAAAPPAPALAFAQQHHLLTSMGMVSPTIFDVGANRGQTADAYRRQFPDARIVCIEPFPDLVAALCTRFAGDPRVTVLPYAASDHAGVRAFHVTDRDDQNSLLPRPTLGRRYFPSDGYATRIIEVPTITVDEIVASGQAPAPDILKFDVQGAELMALQGATTLLGSGRVHVIYAEVWFVSQYEGAPLFHDVWMFLARYGYSVYAVHDFHTAANGQLRVADAIFVTPAVRARALDPWPDEA
jgi:FkbM family methyltransferase